LIFFFSRKIKIKKAENFCIKVVKLKISMQGLDTAVRNNSFVSNETLFNVSSTNISSFTQATPEPSSLNQADTLWILVNNCDGDFFVYKTNV
jgi:hypothetical protein